MKKESQAKKDRSVSPFNGSKISGQSVISSRKDVQDDHELYLRPRPNASHNISGEKLTNDFSKERLSMFENEPIAFANLQLKLQLDPRCIQSYVNNKQDKKSMY